MQPYSVPILFIIFNRPEKTRRVFEAIRKTRPTQLFIAADGPRDNKPGEKELCDAVREIVKNVDWPCQVTTRFQEKNLGCKINASGAVSWLFEHVEEGIILEDDCLPTPSFFPYCKEILARYRNNPEVMHVNGTNSLTSDEVTEPSFSYHFSRCPQLWGWATWRRAWNKYDISMEHLDNLTEVPTTKNIFLSKKHLKFWIKHCKHIRDKNVDTWDAQWQYTIMYLDGQVVTPHTNLIANIGFGSGATHTHEIEHYEIPVQEIALPLQHPPVISTDKKADYNLIEKLYIKGILEKILLKIQLLWSKKF